MKITRQLLEAIITEWINLNHKTGVSAFDRADRTLHKADANYEVASDENDWANRISGTWEDPEGKQELKAEDKALRAFDRLDTVGNIHYDLNKKGKMGKAGKFGTRAEARAYLQGIAKASKR